MQSPVRSPDVLLLDINMPQMNGLKCSKHEGRYERLKFIRW
jgi:YesN/AraC family two-component response regulator